ncbi:MAG: 4-hydroxy-tetrahydrodipicolinate reductase [Actinobacteria bacterium]|nr:4-hydroxy-tetrahydrodipicolinate reductase [Actinomycetota bacterium]
MGQIVARAIAETSDLELSALVDVSQPGQLFGAQYHAALGDIAANDIDVVVDFSTLETARESILWCIRNQRHAVVGTTGFTPRELEEMEAGIKGSSGVVIAANFAVGAVLLQRFAKLAAPFFTRVELIEYHHDQKVDAPSGTALETARVIREARAEAGVVTPPEPTTHEVLPGSRGADYGDGINIHAVRLPGLVAHQEVLFGREGEGLTVRHDAFDRSSFAAGVVLAVRKVQSKPGLTIGLDPLL